MTEETKEPASKETVEDMVKKIQDAAFAKGFEKAQSLAPFADRPNSAVMQDEGLLDYEAEMKAARLEILSEGGRLHRDNPKFAAIRDRYGR